MLSAEFWVSSAPLLTNQWLSTNESRSVQTIIPQASVMLFNNQTFKSSIVKLLKNYDKDCLETLLAYYQQLYGNNCFTSFKKVVVVAIGVNTRFAIL